MDPKEILIQLMDLITNYSNRRKLNKVITNPKTLL